jgi:hypothetical protein
VSYLAVALVARSKDLICQPTSAVGQIQLLRISQAAILIFATLTFPLPGFSGKILELPLARQLRIGSQYCH